MLACDVWEVTCTLAWLCSFMYSAMASNCELLVKFKRAYSWLCWCLSVLILGWQESSNHHLLWECFKNSTEFSVNVSKQVSRQSLYLTQAAYFSESLFYYNGQLNCRCISVGKDEEDYRPLFENFLQDLLVTLNRPDWPAAEVLLTLLGKLLVRWHIIFWQI